MPRRSTHSRKLWYSTRLSPGSKLFYLPLYGAIFLSFMNPGVSPFPRGARVRCGYRVPCLFLCRKRQQPLSPRLLGWITSVFNADLNNIREINGLDCYFFVRFLRMMVRVMLPIWLLSWAVLIPLTTVKTKVDGHSGLDKLIFGNIATNRQPRYAGHVLLAWLFTSKIHGWSPYDSC